MAAEEEGNKKKQLPRAEWLPIRTISRRIALFKSLERKVSLGGDVFGTHTPQLRRGRGFAMPAHTPMSRNRIPKWTADFVDQPAEQIHEGLTLGAADCLRYVVFEALQEGQATLLRRATRFRSIDYARFGRVSRTTASRRLSELANAGIVEVSGKRGSLTVVVLPTENARQRLVTLRGGGE